MLVDGGGSYDDRFDVGRYVVALFLWHERIGIINTIVLTHPHPDHVNGLPYILENFDVKGVWTNGDESIDHWGVPRVEKMKQKGVASSGTGRQEPPSSARTCTEPSASPRMGAVTRSFHSKAHDLYCLSGGIVLAISLQISMLGAMPS